MAEFNANIVVQPYNIDVTLNQPGITINPDVTSLNIYAVGGTNGQPAGNVGDIQYYAANGFAAIPSNVANYTGGDLNLNISNLTITGGNNGYFLQTDGNGNINWSAGGGGGNGSPGGSNTQIQYNDSGLFAGSTGFTFNNTSNLVSMPGNLSVAGAFVGNAAGLTDIPASNVTGTVANATYAANANYASFAGSTTSANTASTVTANAQPNITSVGNLTGLNVTGVSTAAILRSTELRVALALDAGQTLQDLGAVAVGPAAGFYAQGSNAVAISYAAGRDTQGDNSIAIGANSALNFQGANSIAIGLNAASNGQGSNSIAIGLNAGANVQSTNSIAIGTNAAPNGQPANSIVINATGANLDAAGANRFYIKPVRSNQFSTIMYYDGTTGEVTYGLPLTPSFANTAGTVTTNAQPNITSVGTLTSLTVSGNANTGPLNVSGNLGVSNINVTANIIANGDITGSNITGRFVKGTTNLNIPAANGNLTVSVAGTTNVAVFSNTSVNVAGAINATGNITGNYIKGNGAFLTGITVSGGTQILNGNSDISVQLDGNANVTINGTSNVVVISTSGMFVTGVANITGNVNAGNVNATRGAFTNVSGNGSTLTSINGGNVTGAVANSLYSANAGNANVVTNASQPSITSVGTMTGLTVNGTASVVTINANGSANLANVTMTSGGNLNAPGNIGGNNLSITNAVTAATYEGRLLRQAMSQVVSGRNNSAVPATINYDVYNNQFVFYTQNLSNNVTLNFRGNSTANLDSVLPNNTTTFNTILMSQGTGNSYYISNVTVDGSSSNVTVLWNQTPSTVTSGKPIVYKFTINNESNNYYILGDWYNTA